MGKNVLILSGSPRKGGNSDLLCDEFMRGAQEKGNNVEKIRIAAKKSTTMLRLLLLPRPSGRMCTQG